MNGRFSLDNIQAANDRTLRLANRLELPDVYRDFETGAPTASDGQKFEGRKGSLNANSSFKYSGKGQGASTCSFIDDRQLLRHSLVFSAAERESAQVIDGVMRNDAVQSAIPSTGSQGYAEAIFAAAPLIGVSYAPRLNNIAKQTLSVFASRRASERPGQPRYVKTQRGWHYINDLGLRQAIEQQLSRIEPANRLTHDVAIGAPGEFIQADTEDQEVAEALNRLIKTSIVCSNDLYLEHKLATIISNTGSRRSSILGNVRR